MATKLKCYNCGYKFLLKTKIPDRCPYCATVGTVKQSETAQSMLEDL
ncbi:hypothetical protein ACFL0V_03015 [Nanoarchaeota archaeon]